MKNLESLIYNILNSKYKKKLVIILTAAAFSTLEKCVDK